MSSKHVIRPGYSDRYPAHIECITMANPTVCTFCRSPNDVLCMQQSQRSLVTISSVAVSTTLTISSILSNRRSLVLVAFRTREVSAAQVGGNPLVTRGQHSPNCGRGARESASADIAVADHAMQSTVGRSWRLRCATPLLGSSPELNECEGEIADFIAFDHLSVLRESDGR